MIRHNIYHWYLCWAALRPRFDHDFGKKPGQDWDHEICRNAHLCLHIQAHLKLRADAEFGAKRDNSGNTESNDAGLEQQKTSGAKCSLYYCKIYFMVKSARDRT